MTEIDVFELEKPKSFRDFLGQIEMISKETRQWINKLIEKNKIARQHLDIIDKDEIKDGVWNISQNIIELAQLMQDKEKGEK